MEDIHPPGEGGVGVGAGEETMEDDERNNVMARREASAGTSGRNQSNGGTVGPKKTKVLIRDAAWSTWWAVLYWV
jgi:hypothetical protein